MQESVKSTQGTLILILGPSGCGKGTIIKHLKDTRPDFVFPASYTTRSPRPNEEEGDVYHFLSKEEFKEKIKNNKLLEWAIVHQDNYYGTSKKDILDALAEGKTVVREVDIQGVESIKEIIPEENLVTVFITTDTWEELKERIIGRAPMSEEELAQRKESYIIEKQYSDKCNYVIHSITGKIQQALDDMDQILEKIGV